jgi:hypothetical protein
MATVGNALGSLAEDAQSRVLTWANAKFRVTPAAGQTPAASLEGGGASLLGELLDRAQPTNRGDRALLIGHWFHSRGEADFTGQAVNDELKNLGDPAPNITDLMSSLMARRPAPVRQTRRTGSGRQARKRYALTEAGRTLVAQLLTRPQ